MSHEPFGDAPNLAAESLELPLDRLILNLAGTIEDAAAAATGTTYGTAQARSARVANSIVLMA